MTGDRDRGPRREAGTDPDPDPDTSHGPTDTDTDTDPVTDADTALSKAAPTCGRHWALQRVVRFAMRMAIARVDGGAPRILS